MSNSHLPEELSDLTNDLANVFARRLTFLLAGRTGVGKSSAINSLLGREVAPTDPYQPTTFEVKTYPAEINGIRCEVIDTPGLCDDLEDAGNDDEYLGLIRTSLAEIDCLWYVTRLDETRVSADEKRSIKLISNGLGAGIWKHAVLVFTFANSIPAGRLKEALKIRSELIRAEIIKHSNIQSGSLVPAVAIDNSSPVLTDQTLWLPELFTTTVERIREGGVSPFLFATSDRLGGETGGASEESDIPLDEDQKERVKQAASKEPGIFSKLFSWAKDNFHRLPDLLDTAADHIPDPRIKGPMKILASVLRVFGNSKG